MKQFLAQGRADFLTGLAVVLPVVISVAVVAWLFGAVSHFTDALLVFVPELWIGKGDGLLRITWSIVGLLTALLLTGMVGRVARYYVGRKLIQVMDHVLMRVPLLNRVYTAMKQIHEALTSNKTASFKQVVLLEFPRPGFYSIGFVTGAKNAEVRAKTQKQLLGVFVPTPPLTSGSIVMVPEADVIRLDMSVADGLKFIMSLGSVSPAYLPSEGSLPAASAEPREPYANRAKGALDWTPIVRE